jgi:hypothetical protein
VLARVARIVRPGVDPGNVPVDVVTNLQPDAW